MRKKLTRLWMDIAISAYHQIHDMPRCVKAICENLLYINAQKFIMARINNMLFLLSCFLLAPAIEASSFVRLELPQGVSLELPVNWKVLSENSRITLSSWVESQIQSINRNDITNTMPFYAKYYDDSGRASAAINIRYYPTTPITEKEALSGGIKFTNDLDEAIRDDYKIGYELSGGKSLSWLGTKTRSINGRIYFISESRGISADGKPWYNYLVRRLNAHKSFTAIISYNEDHVYF